MGAIKRLSIVLAKWCPHCVPLSLSYARKMAGDLGVPLRVLDIDIPAQLKIADELVEKYGDWSEDYLIPQVFIEYKDGRVSHILTGFSEGVAATEAAWKALFASKYYHTLVDEQHSTGSEALNDFVGRYLTFKGQCHGHCNETTSFVSLQTNSDSLVGVYVCPDEHVSRIIYFSVNPDINWFKNFILDQVGEANVNDRDIRMATRHGWELGADAIDEINAINPAGVIKEVYLAANPKAEAEKGRGVFLCSDLTGEKGCGSLFIRDMMSRERLCPKCRKPP